MGIKDIRDAVDAFVTFNEPDAASHDGARQVNWTNAANSAINLIAERWRAHHNHYGTTLQVDGDIFAGGIRGNDMYGIQSSVTFADGSSRQIPHWYLNGGVQGILSAASATEHALRLLRLVNPDANFLIYAQNVGTGEAATLNTKDTLLFAPDQKRQ